MGGENSRHIRLRIRTAAGEPAIGPGKIDLLEHIERTGSISAAARHMGMSYRRAWGLVQIMNGAFQENLVEGESGGSKGGGARLTRTGREVLGIYRMAEAAAMKASRGHIEKIRSLLKGPDTTPQNRD